jgi:CHAT domain-containing protein
MVKALRGISIFHFCGHGRADSDNPSRSALLVYPDLKELPVEVEPFEYFTSNAQEWQTEGENERSTLIPNFGRLYELEVAQNQTVERRIEYGERGTLWGRFKNGALMQVAEMWTAGDILVEGSLRDCRLVFLSACEAGGGSLSSEMDEYSGLPAALQLAGASTIICSLWPVSDALTALFVDMFYKTLTRGKESANIVAIVQKISSRLRRMNKKQATSLLNGLRKRTTASRARFILEAYTAQIKKGRQLPFSHPYDWGAFYVTGASTVYFPKETTS